jgi:hypothetical protein
MFGGSHAKARKEMAPEARITEVKIADRITFVLFRLDQHPPLAIVYAVTVKKMLFRGPKFVRNDEVQRPARDRAALTDPVRSKSPSRPLSTQSGRSCRLTAWGAVAPSRSLHSAGPEVPTSAWRDNFCDLTSSSTSDRQFNHGHGPRPAQTKFAASVGSPAPVYCASSG